MDFQWTDENELIRANLREFTAKNLDPIAGALDAEGRYPAEVMAKLGEMDFMGICFPTEYGGGGADFVTGMLVAEELARSCAATGFTYGYHLGLVCDPICRFGSGAQKEAYLPGLCSGKLVGSFALTEPGAGTDVGAASAAAVSDGSDYVLNGTKTFITNAPIADVFLVFALTDREKGLKGVSAFLIPKGTPGLSIGQHFDKMGIRASQTAEVVLRDCRIPASARLGEEGQGFRIAMQTLDTGRIGVAAQAVGILQAALDESVAYAKQRIQFGKPIASQQAVQWMIADMSTDLAAARFLTYHAAWLKDQGKTYSKEAAMAKVFAAEAAVRHTAKAVQIHGGYGYIKGQKVERLMRDAKVTEIYEGTSEAQRMVIASSILR